MLVWYGHTVRVVNAIGPIDFMSLAVAIAVQRRGRAAMQVVLEDPVVSGPGERPSRPSGCVIYIIGISFVGDTVETAKVFWSGRSQAVRLPKHFRVEGREVRIARRGNAIILEPVPETWEWVDAIAGALDEDFVEAVKEQPEPTERPGLEKLFR